VADFGIGKSIAAMGDKFKDVKRAFDSGRGARIGTCHRASPLFPQNDSVPSVEYEFRLLNSVLYGRSMAGKSDRDCERMFSLLNGDTC
jgi:hypothetical protein